MEGQHQVLRTLREPQALARVQRLLRAGDVANRTALADAGCAQFGFIDARGRAQRSSCLKALRALEAENARLKKMVAERDLEIYVMKDIAKNRW